MSQHITRYKTENGKTRRVKNSAAKPADKNGSPESKSGDESKNNQPAPPAK